MNREEIKALIHIPGGVSDVRQEQFIENLFLKIDEHTDIVSSKQAADIWNLRSFWLYKIESNYTDSTIRLRSGSHSIHPLRKLTPAEKTQYLGLDVPGRSYFFLKDVLTIEIRPWKNLGLRKPEFLRVSESIKPTHVRSKKRKPKKRNRRLKKESTA